MSRGSNRGTVRITHGRASKMLVFKKQSFFLPYTNLRPQDLKKQKILGCPGMTEGVREAKMVVEGRGGTLASGTRFILSVTLP